ncbi:MAG: hypothetical protein PHE04_06540 [Bacteroidales bacterium]|nr:hypothetical protein [Bacteroidales bacterium]MDD3430877.1 hypothetical protein [Bacteroidales bacterium]MDD4361279.1 hypothetical protein [Bacteroidales bacterium]MDD4430009.1 hypothetical protein [Bacteroidales bacterium]
MKKILFSLAAVLIVCASFAQNDDPFRTGENSGSLKVQEEGNQPFETTVQRKKTQTPKEAPKEEEKPTVTVNNPSKDIKVEFVSCIGNRAAQTFELTIKVTNFQVNQQIYLNTLLAYDNQGDENYAYGSSWEALTDVTVKQVYAFRNKVLPSKVDKLSVIKLPFAKFGSVEFRNVTIDWR